MLKKTMNHEQFQCFLREQLVEHYLSKGQTATILLSKELLEKVWLTDLSKVLPVLAPLYSTRGRPARDPLAILRSLLLMRFCGIRSMEKWVHELRRLPLLAILSGFEPHDVPGTGTLYDFQKRLWAWESASYRSKIRKSRTKPKKKMRKGEKQPLRRPGIVRRLVEHFLKHPVKLQKQPYHVLQQIFKQGFVLPSASKGLLGDINNLSVAGDGTTIRTGAARYGKPQCDCRKQGVFKCSCPREFTDPDASWGWDSYRGEYFYGRNLYIFTAADSPNDLPLYLNLFYAERHDSACFVPAFFEMMRLYPEFRFRECLLDSAHDAMPIYQALRQLDINALIDLNPRNLGSVKINNNITLNQLGIPVCQAGHIMSYDGFCKDRQRHKWRCPKTRKSWNVACDQSCSESAYGRVFYTYEEDNLRYFTRIPRDSAVWKERYKRRTSVERTNKRLKQDYKLEEQKRRNTRDWQIEVLIQAGCLHIDAWVKHAELDLTELIYSWINTVTA